MPQTTAGFMANSPLRFLSLAGLLCLLAPTPGWGAPGTGTLKVVSGHSGSVVFVNEIRHGTTGDEGVLELQIKAGSYSVRVRTVGYVDWRGAAVIRSGATSILRVSQRPTRDEAVLSYQRGDELRDKGRHTEAVEQYSAALTRQPGLAEAGIGIARSLVSLQRFDEAEEALTAALKKGGRRRVEAQTVFGNMRRAQGLIDEAIAEYRKALRLARGISPEAHIGLALALQDAGRMDEAIPEFRLGIAQDMDTEPILYYLLGSALEKEGRNRHAIDAYRHYLRLAPDGQYSSAVESMIERLK